MSTYDDIKTYKGKRYTGMRVGGKHRWTYPNGEWREEKVSPNEWRIDFTSMKRRKDPAPPRSGASQGSQYHWMILGHQKVRKVGNDTYRTRLKGQKFKVAHKRPGATRWSTQRPDQPSEREQVIRYLEEALERLRKEQEAEADQAKLGRWG